MNKLFRVGPCSEKFTLKPCHGNSDWRKVLRKILRTLTVFVEHSIMAHSIVVKLMKTLVT